MSDPYVSSPASPTSTCLTPAYPVSPLYLAVQVDIYMFVVLSGVVTAIALREPPRFAAPDPATASTSTTAAAATAEAEAEESYGLKGSGGVRYLSLLPRTPFDLRRFMQVRRAPQP